MIWLLIACGSSTPLADPNPPPTPPSLLALQDSNIVTLSGTVSDVQGRTRTWLVTADGEPTVAVLEENGTLQIGGRAGMPSDLVDGTSIRITGRQKGDIMLVQRAEVAPTAADPAVPAPTDPAVPGAPPPTDAAGAPIPPGAPTTPAAPAAPTAPTPAPTPTPTPAPG